MSDHAAHMKLITIHFPPKILKTIDVLIDMGLFPNRSEFVRFAVMGQILDLKLLLREEL